MLEGLEVSILYKKTLENQFTIGAEYYSRVFIDSLNKLKASGYKVDTLENIATRITDGDHSATNYQESGIRYLLSECIQEGYIDLTKSRYIAPALHKELKRSALKYGDVLITKTGIYFGKSTVVPDNFGEANTSAHVGIVRLKEDIDINPYYLSTFFNSKFGYYQLRRRGIKVSRPEIKLLEFNDIQIPYLGAEIQEIIKKLVIEAGLILERANQQFTALDEMFLQRMGLVPNSFSNVGYSTKSFKESFLKTGRLDAEYYQPKYDDLLAVLSNFDTDILENLVSIKKSIEPGSDAYRSEGIPFMRVADLSKYGLSDPEIFLNENEYNIEDLRPLKDTILLSKDGSVGIAYKVKSDMDVITSGAILHLTVKDKGILPDYLCMVLNSIVVQLQAERDAGGSVIQHWKPDEIKQVVIPILPLPIQEEIVNMVQNGFALRGKSKELLEAAKCVVEISIEQGESAAMKWLVEKNLIQ